MQLVVNGETRDLSAGATVSALLEDLGIDPERVAVLVNDDVIPAECRALTPLHAGDRVEVLSFACGG